MKRTIKNIFLISILAILFIGCEKTRYLDLPYEEERIVINGIMTPDYGLWINLTRSISVYNVSENPYFPINDAVIEYYEYDSLISTITDGNDGSYYERDFLPEEGHEYKMVVNRAGFEETSAIVHMPFSVPIIEFDTSFIFNEIHPHDSIMYKVIEVILRLKFQDPVDVRNFYMIEAGFWNIEGQFQAIEVNADNFITDPYIEGNLEILAWDDELINGQTNEIELRFTQHQPVGLEVNYVIVLYSIEEAHFRYMKTYSQFAETGGDLLFIEPVPVFSNIEGGLGIVAAVSGSEISFSYIF